MKHKIGDIINYGSRTGEIVEFDSFDLLYKVRLNDYDSFVYLSEKFLDECVATCVCGAKYDTSFPNNHLPYCDVAKQSNMDATINNLERMGKK